MATLSFRPLPSFPTNTLATLSVLPGQTLYERFFLFFFVVVIFVFSPGLLLRLPAPVYTTFPTLSLSLSGVAFPRTTTTTLRSSSICARTLVAPFLPLFVPSPAPRAAFSCASHLFRPLRTPPPPRRRVRVGGESGRLPPRRLRPEELSISIPPHSLPPSPSLPPFFLHSEIRRSFTNDFRGNSAPAEFFESPNPFARDSCERGPPPRAARRNSPHGENARHVKSPRRLLGHCSRWTRQRSALYCKLPGLLCNVGAIAIYIYIGNLPSRTKKLFK